MKNYTMKNYRDIITCLISGALLVLSPLSLWAQNPSGRAFVDKDSMRVGDQATLQIEVDLPGDAQWEWPVLTDSISGHIEIIQGFPLDTVRSTDGLKLTGKYVITSFDSGFHQPHPLLVPVRISGQTDTLRIDLPPVQVTLVPADSARKIYDIKPVYTAAITFHEIFPYILGLLVLMAITILLYRYLRKRKSRENRIPDSPRMSIPAHLQAIRELDALRGEKLWQAGKTKEYYTRLTDIVRFYLHRRFGISALESTTSEILDDLKQSDFEDNQLMNKLEDLFISADLVKFAKSDPLADENETHLLDAYLFVNNTKPECPDFSSQSGQSETSKTNI